MSEPDGDFFDEELSEKPATRFELWKSMQLVRALVADVHIYHLASQVGNQDERAKASEAFRATTAKLDDFADELISLKRSKERSR